MPKKKDLPAMPFYFGDWRKAPEIRALDLDVRMIWFEMIGYMWESTERGYFTLNDKPVITPVISKMIGVDISTMERALQQMEEFNVYSKRKDGSIFCRKMVRDEEMRLAKSEAGKEGMKRRYGKKSVITEPLTSTENEIEENSEENNSKDKKPKIPSLVEFMVYADSLCTKTKRDFNSLRFALEMKYQTWVDDGWRTGHGKPIKNWKNTLGNTFPHLKPIKPNSGDNDRYFSDQKQDHTIKL